MENKQKNILLGLGGLALLLLSRKSKVKSLSSKYGDWDNSRFTTFDYYSAETQEEIKEQTLKDKQYYYGDSSPMAVYDPFYDYSDSFDQKNILDVARGGESFSDLGEVSAFRARIVPNSFCFVTTPSYGSECYVYFLVEIFNPFKFTLDKTRIAQPKDIFFDNLRINGKFLSDCGDHDALNSFLAKYHYSNKINPSTNIVESYNNFFYGERSVFIPALSVIPNITYPYGSYGDPMWLNKDNCPSKFAKHEVPDGDGTRYEYVLEDPRYDWIEEVSVDLHLQLRSSAPHVTTMVITKGNTNSTKFTYNASTSKSVSTQKPSYFNWNGYVPIFKRQEVCEVLYPYKSSDLDTYTHAKSGYWESLNMLKHASKYPPFGDLNPLGVLFK